MSELARRLSTCSPHQIVRRASMGAPEPPINSPYTPSPIPKSPILSSRTSNPPSLLQTSFPHKSPSLLPSPSLSPSRSPLPYPSPLLPSSSPTFPLSPSIIPSLPSYSFPSQSPTPPPFSILSPIFSSFPSSSPSLPHPSFPLPSNTPFPSPSPHSTLPSSPLTPSSSSFPSLSSHPPSNPLPSLSSPHPSPPLPSISSPHPSPPLPSLSSPHPSSSCFPSSHLPHFPPPSPHLEGPSFIPTPVSCKPGVHSTRRASHYDIPDSRTQHHYRGKRFSLDVSWLLTTTKENNKNIHDTCSTITNNNNNNNSSYEDNNKNIDTNNNTPERWLKSTVPGSLQSSLEAVRPDRLRTANKSPSSQYLLSSSLPLYSLLSPSPSSHSYVSPSNQNNCPFPLFQPSFSPSQHHPLFSPSHQSQFHLSQSLSHHSLSSPSQHHPLPSQSPSSQSHLSSYQPHYCPSSASNPHVSPSTPKFSPFSHRLYSSSSSYYSSPSLLRRSSSPLLRCSPSLPSHQPDYKCDDDDDLYEGIKRKRRSLHIPRIILDEAESIPSSIQESASESCHNSTQHTHLSPHHTHHKRKRHSISVYSRRHSYVSAVWHQERRASKVHEGGRDCCVCEERRDCCVYEGRRKDCSVCEGRKNYCDDRKKGNSNIPPRRASWHALTLSPVVGPYFPHAGVFTPSLRDNSFRYSPVFPGSNLSPESIHLSRQTTPKLNSPFPGSPRPIGAHLGQGGFGVVKVGCYKGRKVAVKVLKGDKAASTCSSEALALPLSPCPHILTLYAVVTPATPPYTHFARVKWAAQQGGKDQILPLKSVSSIFRFSLDEFSTSEDDGENGSDNGEDKGPGWGLVVSEMCSSLSLLSLINKSSIPLPTTTKIRFLHELAMGVSFLHSHGLIHLDVKPANVLITSHGHLKLADFGCCKDVHADDDDEDLVLGTVVYQAPEVLGGEGRGYACDVYSMGITIWHLLTRTCPYPHLHPHVVLYQVVRLGLRPPDQHPPISPPTYLDTLLLNLAVRCWHQCPDLRPTSTLLCRTLAMLRLATPPKFHNNKDDLDTNLHPELKKV